MPPPRFVPLAHEGVIDESDLAWSLIQTTGVAEISVGGPRQQVHQLPGRVPAYLGVQKTCARAVSICRANFWAR